MRRPARTRLAGTLISIPLWALSCAAAISQNVSSVLSNQTQAGDILSDLQLTVITVTGNTSGVSTGMGNALQTSVQTGASANLNATQTLSGQVTARTVLHNLGSSGDITSLTTNAHGNANTSGVADGGALDAFVIQSASGAGVVGRSQVEADQAYTGDLSANVTAAANSQGLAADGAYLRGRITQTSSANVLADGGAILGYTPNSGVIAGTAAGNNVDATGSNGSVMDVLALQSNTAANIQASQFTAYGQVQTAITSATASGNNVNLVNDGSPTTVATDQTNTAYVRAQSETTAFSFGETHTTAYGVGNSTLVGGIGDEVTLANTQVNSGGGLEVNASFAGTGGYDAYVTSTAIANAVTAYACADCDGRVNATNSQTNSADAAAVTVINMAGPARRVNGVASAIGNSGSFYVSQPN